MPHLRIDDLDLYYEVHGPDQPDSGLSPLLLIAGLGTDSQSWLPVLPALGARRQVVTFDNRGCGRTWSATDSFTPATLAADTLALADALGLSRFDLLGHSMGGFIALECALRAPTRIARLVLANTAAANPPRNDLLFADWANAYDGASGPALATWFRNFFYWIFTPALFADRAVLDQWLALATGYPYLQTPAGFRAQVAAIAGFDRRAALPGIHLPTLVLAGGADLLFPPADDAAGLAAMPQARVQVLPGQAHGLYAQAPALFTDAVLAFLDGQAQAPSGKDTG